jgi:hypothetical protein
MAIAEVKQSILSQDVPLTIHVTAAFSSTAGNLLVLTYGGDDGAFVSSVTDSQSNVWVQVPGAATSFSDVWYVASSKGGSAIITLTLANSDASVIVVTEFSGAGASPLLTGSGAIVAFTSGAAVSPALTPTTAGQLLVTSICPININFTGISSPWVGYTDNIVSGVEIGYYINPPLSTQRASAVPNTTQNYLSSGAIFIPSSGGPSGAQQASTFLVFE